MVSAANDTSKNLHQRSSDEYKHVSYSSYKELLDFEKHKTAFKLYLCRM